MLKHHTAVAKDKNGVIRTFNLVERDSGSQRLFHLMSMEKVHFNDVNVSQCPNTHQCHKSEAVDLFHLIRVQHDATGSLMGVSGMKLRNTE